jgi:hypothetical protein
MNVGWKDIRFPHSQNELAVWMLNYWSQVWGLLVEPADLKERPADKGDQRTQERRRTT